MLPLVLVTLTLPLITFESFWHKSGYEPFLAMRAFAE
jgi:hypothetical protein